MRKTLLASTILAFAVCGARAQTTVVTPGQGSVTDAAGNTWQVSADGSVLENGDTWTAGGGGTKALVITDGVIYGEDARGRGWFQLSASGQTWSSVPASAALGIAPLPALTAPTATVAAAPSTSYAALPCIPSAGEFGILSGQIYDPNQQVFVPHGIDVYDSAMGSASQILAIFPGINFIRLNVYSYGSPSAYQAFINTVTAAGVVVMVDWHVGAGGGVEAPTGGALTTEAQWFGSMAAAYKSNPRVWFNSLNEPANNQQTYDEQTAVYNAIRGAGSNAIVMLEWAGQTDGSYASGWSNFGIDAHYYGWQSNYSTDESAIRAAFTSTVNQVHQAFGDNVAIVTGEFGPSTNGNTSDPNGNQVVSFVLGSGYGYAAWNYDSGAPADNLTQNGGMTSYGQTVSAGIGSSSGTTSGGSACTASAPTTTAAVVASASPPTQPTTAPEPSASTAAANAASASVADAQQGLATADEQLQTAPQTPTAAATASADANEAEGDANLAAATAALQATPQ